LGSPTWIRTCEKLRPAGAACIYTDNEQIREHMNHSKYSHMPAGGSQGVLYRIIHRIILCACTSLFMMAFSCSGDEKAGASNQEIWFRYPAKYWNSQALHLGNSYFGASFFGGIEEEVFTLTEKSMWTGGPAMGRWEEAGVNPRALESLPAIRDAVVRGEAGLADSLIASDFFGSDQLYGHFTTIGDLKVRFRGDTAKASCYIRMLDLKHSLGSVSFTLDGIPFEREYFCSYPDRVLVMRFTAGKPGNISFDLGLDPVQDSSVVEIEGNYYRFSGWINGNRRPFQVLVAVSQKGGVTRAEEELLSVQGADEAEVYLTAATNYRLHYPEYRGEDPGPVASAVIKNALDLGFEALKKRHIADYTSLYDRVSLHIEGGDATARLPTNERFERLRSGSEDPGYKVLAFNLGRYLIISSSRPGTLPANLQGVWNTFRVAPWAGNYQSNVNIQEIYWSCGPTGLIECQEPYIDWIEDLARSGRQVALRVYGTEGWVSHTTGNIWGHAAPVGDHPWGMYPMGAAWHCQHVWDHYRFTGDREYLRERAYPLLREASLFWLENLVPFKGSLIAAPSVSAEHGALLTESGLNPAYHDLRSDLYRYSLEGPAQDAEMVWDLFTNTAEAAVLLGDTTFAGRLMGAREHLLPLRTGRYGQLQEWYRDIDDPQCHHRHISHLFAVCPGRQIHPTTTPELSEAAKISLDMRGDGRFPEQELASGGNWARAHRMWCWTRLMDGNRAMKIMNGMLTEQGFENVLTFQHASYHWERQDLYTEKGLYLHFMLDGSAALPGCIAEMLVQSHMGEVHLLPALPDEFHTGSVSGIRARGGFIVDMEWKDGELVSATIFCPPGKEIPAIRLKKEIVAPGTHPEIRITKLRS
jgi:alpha-L-fucosidase 2